MPALAIAAVVSSLASAGISAAQMIQQKRLMENAQDAAQRAFADARKRLSVNYFEGLSVQKEPYALQREALMVSASQALDAAREGSRGAGAAAGLVQMAHLQGEERITTAMQRELADRERLIIGEDARLQGLQAELSLNEAEGAQIAAANNQNMMNQATANMMQGITSAALTGARQLDLYKKDGGSPDEQKLADALAANTASSLSVGFGNVNPQTVPTDVMDDAQKQLALQYLQQNPDLLSNLLKNL